LNAKQRNMVKTVGQDLRSPQKIIIAIN
jgi:hypothetical protein